MKEMGGKRKEIGGKRKEIGGKKERNRGGKRSKKSNNGEEYTPLMYNRLSNKQQH